MPARSELKFHESCPKPVIRAGVRVLRLRYECKRYIFSVCVQAFESPAIICGTNSKKMNVDIWSIYDCEIYRNFNFSGRALLSPASLDAWACAACNTPKSAPNWASVTAPFQHASRSQREKLVGKDWSRETDWERLIQRDWPRKIDLQKLIEKGWSTESDLERLVERNWVRKIDRE